MIGIDPRNVAFVGPAQGLLHLTHAVDMVGGNPGQWDSGVDRPVEHH